MRILMLFCCLLLKLSASLAQEFKIDVSYQYLYSGQWDKAIQTYNFSRPFLKEKQPLLMNGLNASSSYIFKNEKYIKHGLYLGYSYFRSLAENENLINKLNLHFVSIGYLLHYENLEKHKGLYADLIISARSSVLYRKVNGEPFVYDEKRSKALGIGGDLQFKLGYCFNLKNKSYVSPLIAVGYTPYFYASNSESVINQTKTLASKSWTSILTVQLGIAYIFK